MPPSRARRAPAACSRCRVRKIKCNNERPACVNCKAYGHECVYEPISESAKEAGRLRHERKKLRKSQQQSASSQAPESSHGGDNDELQQQRSPSGHGAASVHDNSSSISAHENTNPLEEQNGPREGVARILVSDSGVSSYHGRTSTLYEDHPQERSTAQHPRMPDEWVERGLVAEAARQRQLEELNYRHGKLDFDGVEPDLGMHLLSIHWNRQHHSCLITYRPAFMRDMACGGPYFSKLLLNAIYFAASKFSPRLEVRKDPGDVRTAGWRYRGRVRELLGGALDRSDVTTIQALLLMTNSLFALGDERSAAWLYAGLAFRMLIDLGLHVDLTGTRRFSDEDLEVRRRVFWAAFVVDKIQSLYQGRPSTLKESDALVPIKFLDSYEELEHWQPFAYSSSTTHYPGSPAYSNSTFASLCRLSLTMSEILNSIYTERSSDQTPRELSTMLEKLQLRLDNWRRDLPPHLQLDPGRQSREMEYPPPHVFSLNAMYNVLIILLHRPFVADGHLYSTSRSISVDSFMKCASAASTICSLVRAYHQAFSTRRAPYLISYATYVAATIHSRIAARRGSDSSAHANLATCLAVFEQNQATNSAVNKASLIIQNLMKKLGVTLTPSGDALRNVVMDSAAATATAAEQQAEPVLDVPASNLHTNASSTVDALPPATALGDYSPNDPDWLDIDNIIQSFLHGREGAHAPAGFEPDTAWLPAPSVHNMAGAPATAVGMYPTPTEGSGYFHPPDDSGGSNGFVQDPLFGFNGSATDSYHYAPW
ncbi:C6 transcription factor [Emericellopsis atlantica]|uniref:C6 transcription factor n=1 Tax=Emericellopsis atlantica TaxID=2614577 RepID=A0A9P7ZMJ3_9HYPO|nr:C6 transcription factor [Emericellopsis atlantica]KAG9254452.1 C6 transcription factor [Emericellopsis atlantica]